MQTQLKINCKVENKRDGRCYVSFTKSRLFMLSTLSISQRKKLITVKKNNTLLLLPSFRLNNMNTRHFLIID